jgi:hypothetical protein
VYLAQVVLELVLDTVFGIQNLLTILLKIMKAIFLRTMNLGPFMAIITNLIISAMDIFEEAQDYQSFFLRHMRIHNSLPANSDPGNIS